MDNLSNIIEAILFVAGEPVESQDIISKLEITRKEFNTAINTLNKRYSGESGIILLHINDKYQLSTNSQYVEEISKVMNPIREKALTQSTLQTLAIIAYKQPITRLEVEEIRGVNSDYCIQVLLKHKLIADMGRKETLGRPILFGTTDEFLKRFNLTTIEDLPDYAELLQQIKDIVGETSETLYNEFEIPENKEEDDTFDTGTSENTEESVTDDAIKEDDSEESEENEPFDYEFID